MSEAEAPLLSKETFESRASTPSDSHKSPRWSRALFTVIIGITLSVIFHLSTSKQLRHHTDLPLCPSTEAIPFNAPRNSELFKSLVVYPKSSEDMAMNGVDGARIDRCLEKSRCGGSDGGSEVVVGSGEGVKPHQMGSCYG